MKRRTKHIDQRPGNSRGRRLLKRWRARTASRFTFSFDGFGGFGGFEANNYVVQAENAEGAMREFRERLLSYYGIIGTEYVEWRDMICVAE